MDPGLVSELATEIELLKQSRKRIGQIVHRAETILRKQGPASAGSPSYAEEVLTLLNDIFCLPLTDFLLVAKSEGRLQTTTSSNVSGTTPTNVAPVSDRDHDSVDVGIQVDEEMCAAPSPEDGKDATLHRADKDDAGITRQPDKLDHPNNGDDVVPDSTSKLQSTFCQQPATGQPIVDDSDGNLLESRGLDVKKEPCSASEDKDDQFCNPKEETEGKTEPADSMNLDSGQNLAETPSVQNISQKRVSNRRKKSENIRKSDRINRKSDRINRKSDRINRKSCSKTLTNEKNPDVINPDPDAKLKCDTCGKMLKNAQTLYLHIQRHQTNRPRSQCEICQQTFLRPSSLNYHRKTVHSKMRPRLPCRFPGCGRTYLNKNTLSGHIRSDHGENPVQFRCTTGGKEYKTRPDLENHMPIHMTDAPYKCSTCRKSFSQKGTLKTHEKTHLEKSNRTNFKCPQCPKTFVWVPNLRRHIGVAHGTQDQWNYPCTFCDKRFFQSYELKRHTKAKHPTDQEAIHP